MYYNNTQRNKYTCKHIYSYKYIFFVYTLHRFGVGCLECECAAEPWPFQPRIQDVARVFERFRISGILAFRVPRLLVAAKLMRSHCPSTEKSFNPKPAMPQHTGTLMDTAFLISSPNPSTPIFEIVRLELQPTSSSKH